MAKDSTIQPLTTGDKIDPSWVAFIDRANQISIPDISQAGSSQVIRCSSSRFKGTTFSTAKLLDEFEIDKRPEGAGQTIVLGLDTSDPANALTVTDILTAFSVPVSSLKSPIGPIVSVLSNAIEGKLPTFKLDGTPGGKNGAWLIAAVPNTLEVATALTFQLNGDREVDFGSPVQAALKDLGINVDLSALRFSTADLPCVRLKSKTLVVKGDNESFTTSTVFEVIVQLPVRGYMINLRIDSADRLGVSLLNIGGTFDDLRHLMDDFPSETEASPQEVGFLDDLQLWCISAQFPEPNGKPIFSIGFILTLKFPGQDLTIGLHYDGRVRKFTGGLLFQDMFKDRLKPDFDDLTDLPQGKILTLEPQFDLAKGSPFDSLPNSVPTILSQAHIEYQKGGEDAGSTFSFDGALVSISSMSSAVVTASSGGVPCPFDWQQVSVSYSRQGAKRDGKVLTSINIFSHFQLQPPSARFGSGELSLSLSFSQPKPGSQPQWSLSGKGQKIQIGAIAQFLDQEILEDLLEILGKLRIDSFEVTYTYNRNVASSFLFVCSLSFGELVLNLYYQYASKDAIKTKTTAVDQKLAASSDNDPNLSPMETTDELSSWRFDAYLDTAGPGTTIGSIANSIMDNASEDIPLFVSEIEVHPPDPSAKLITLHIGKVITKTVSIERIVRATFLLSVNISTVHFTFAQVTTGGTAGSTKAKRLLRLSVGQLPFIDKIPVINELPQPYQELQYVWSPALGLTRDEVAALNERLEVEGTTHKLYFKAVSRAALDPTAATDPVVLLQGHHFIVVDNDQAIVDHIFNPTPKVKGSTHNDGTPDDGGAKGSSSPPPREEQPPPDAPPSKGALKKETPFISISAVSFQYKNGRLWIFLDGTIALGPLEFSLVGFGVGLNLTGLKLNNLSHVADDIDFQLRGMEVAFDKPPILIAGAFYHDVIERGSQTEDAYRGGVTVTIPPYTFVAVGEYAEVTTNVGNYKSVFIYAKLDGPIIDFEFAILRGLRIGFGYNSMVRSPAPDELFQFPLLDNGSATGAGNHPMAILEKMRGGDNPWIQLKNDSYWLAFGFTISSFDIINATAVAMVSFRDGGPIFTIMGNLTCALPPDSPSPSARLFYVEVNLYAELNMVEDSFKVLAALAPTSFVYVPMAHLHGSLALYTWFGNNPHAGDWVFSVGGYHRNFQKPEHYPILQRLGLDFNVDIIRIRGEGYFAITPKAVMAGAVIRAELDLGILFAWLDAAFDAMVQFEPMHYWVSMHVEVGVECDIPLLFFTIHIRIHIGALLEIEGPEFGGTAYVDFWFFSFSFDFGSRIRPPVALTLEEFYALCEKSGPPDNSDASKATEGLNVQLKITLEDGSFSMPSDDKVQIATTQPDDTGAGVKWFVKGGSFRFRVSSVFALTEAYIETEDSSEHDSKGTAIELADQIKKAQIMDEVLPTPAIDTLSSMPMQLSVDGDNGIKSQLAISIRDIDQENLPISDFQPSFVVKPMPQVLWADPVKSPPDRLSDKPGTINLPMAVTLEAPDPVLAKAKVPAFNATDMGANQIPQLPAKTQTVLLPVSDNDDRPLDQKWESTRDTWATSSKVNLGIANAMSQLCMTSLGWDIPAASPPTPPTVTTEGSRSHEVPVTFLERLVNGTGREAIGIQDGLKNFYLELPRITQAVL
ncbi:hypothetical protein E8E13_000189 [Curvularia kusanoi]|uniref:DUF6603 domain-containing protein n=1 Tax=Curvularia kusanoi TaxID=90978 RepID=A0A9P4T5C2_CURKU|nr:hypothetical protein E8E13_000189 [Curvularia kusanoi]